MTLPTPQAVEEAISVHRQAIKNAEGQKEWYRGESDLFYWNRIIKAAEDSISVLKSLPSLRQKAEAWDRVVDNKNKSGGISAFTMNCIDNLIHNNPALSAAQKLTPPTK